MQHSIERYKVLGAGILSLILTMGIARFAYTPLLPIMQSQTWLDDANGGWLATNNYLGYLLGAVIAMSVSDLRLKDSLYRAGLVIAVITTAGMAFTESMLLWSVLRFFAGLSSAAGLLLGSGLIMNWLMRHNMRSELGIHFSGAGLGIAFAALAVHLIEINFDWREQWLILSLLGLLILIPAWRWLPRPDQATAQNASVSHKGNSLHDRPPSTQFVRLMMAAYFCAGVGYVISATFIVTIVERQASLQGNGWLAFFIVGVVAAPACIFWDLIARRTGELKALLLAYSLQIIGIMLPLLNDSLWVTIFSAGLYGGTFIGIVSLVLTMAGRFYPGKPAKLMGKFTLSYGVAQITAPAMSGIIAEKTGIYDYALWVAVVFLLIGTCLIAHLIKLDKSQ